MKQDDPLSTKGAEDTPAVAKAESTARRKANDSEFIDAMRARLYERGSRTVSRERHGLREPHQVRQSAVRRSAATPPQRGLGALTDTPPAASVGSHQEPARTASTETGEEEMHLPAGTPPQRMPKKGIRRHRLKFIFTAIGFFLAALGLSSLFLFYGNNTISGSNITIDVSGPFAVGSGEELPLQVGIANQNAVPIESAVLIVNYPPGTQSVTEQGKEIVTDRYMLEDINAGEVVNVPLKARVFGEEDDEQMVHVEIEYRVRGSNATFSKAAEPFRYKINSAPVRLTVDAVERISSGQEAKITLVVSSNSPAPLSNILVKGTYPFGFDFSKSSPDPVSGQNTWLIDALEPGQSTEIVLTGIMTGKQDETRHFTFAVGVSNARDQFNLASVFVKSDVEMDIEAAFLDVEVEVNGNVDEVVAVDNSENSSVRISFTNTLDDTIHNAVIEVQLTGNALNEIGITPVQGFYNSNNNTITWDGPDVVRLQQIEPGQTRSVNFTLEPKAGVPRTPKMNFTVTVKGQRISEANVPRQLIGTASREIRVSSLVDVSSSALYSEGPFTNTGPIPPVVGEPTQYAYLLRVQNGSNDVTDAEVSAVVPQYVTWLDIVSVGDTVTYNPTTRVMTWNIGDVDAGGYEEAWVQVVFTPSITQRNRIPTILETQRLRAVDRFTGALLRETAPALTTSLKDDPDEDAHDGYVQEAD